MNRHAIGSAVLVLGCLGPLVAAETQRKDAHGDPLPPDAVARLGTLRDHFGGSIGALTYQPGTKLLAAWDCSKGGILLLNQSGVVARRLALDHGGSQEVRHLAFSADGNWLTVADDNKLHLRDLRTGNRTIRLAALFTASRVVFSPDGTKLAVTGSWATGGSIAGRPIVIEECAVWDTRTSKELWRVAPCGPALAFAPSGDLATTNGSTIVVRDPATGRNRYTIATGHKTVSCLAFAPNGNSLASAGTEGMVSLWDTVKRTAIPCPLLSDHKGEVHFLAFTPNGKLLVTGGVDGACMVSEAAMGRTLHYKLITNRRRPFALALSPDGKEVATADGSRIQRWRLSADELAPERSSADPARVVVSPDGKSIATSGRPLRMWDSATGRLLYQGPSDRAIHVLAFAPDGKTFLAHDGTCLHFRDARTGKRLREVREPALSGRAFYSADGKKVIVVTDQESVATIAAATGEILRHVTLRGEVIRPAIADLSPDGRLLARAPFFTTDPNRRLPSTQQLITLHDPARGVVLRTFSEEPQEGRDEHGCILLRFSADGRLLAVVGRTAKHEQRVRLWDMTTGRQVNGFSISAPEEERLAASPDGKLLAGGGADGIVRLWEIAAGGEVYQFRGQRGPIQSVTFSPDGTQLITGGADDTVLVWDVAGRSLPESPLASVELQRLWDELAGAGRTAFAARRTLTASPRQAAPFLAERLRASPRDDSPERRGKLIADLDSDTFAVREKAVQQLAEMGRFAEPALRHLLANKPSLEARRRAEDLLSRLENGPPTPGELRLMRGIAALESMHTAEARQVLHRLAQGDADSLLTREAKAAWDRLQRLPAGP